MRRLPPARVPCVALAVCVACAWLAGSAPPTAAAQGGAREVPGWSELPVPGGEAALAVLGIEREERAFALPLLARALHDRDGRARMTKLRGFAAPAEDDGEITIPIPLDLATWRDVLPPIQGLDSNDLFTRLLSDRNALMLVVGLMNVDESTRAWLARQRDLLRFIYGNAAGAFALVARRLRVVDGRIAVPGGEEGAAIWAALAGESPARLDRFLRALLTRDAGRLAWYYDTIGGLDEQRLQAAWPRPRVLDSATRLYAAFRDADPQWRTNEQPYRRSPYDAWMVVTQNDVEGDHVVSPLSQEAWARLFSDGSPTRQQIERALAGNSPVTLPWLATQTSTASVRERRDRFEMFRLAQRIFAATPGEALADVAVALSGVRDHRALVLALERMGVATPAAWAAAVAAARHVSGNAEQRRESIVAFQGVVALLERIRHVRAIDVATAERLVISLSDAVRKDRMVTASLARWIVDTLVPALPRLVQPDAFTGRTAYESTILQALAGPAERQTRTLDWEGLTYTVDIVAAEHERLRAMRALLPSPGLDAALASGQPRELAEALQALVYAVALGDPEGPASLSPDVVRRHVFGFGGTAITRDELPWSPPEERHGVGPWHVQGALIGLDLALSRLTLRRVADQQMPQAPTLTLNDLGTLTRTAVAMVAAELDDDDRDEIAAAIARGRARVQAAGTPAELRALADECRMSEVARQLIPWIAARSPETLGELFSLRDLMWLGQPRLSRRQLDYWGVAATPIDGRQVTAMPPPAPWEDYAGRSEAGQMTTQVPDVTLRLVEETAALKLPATLVPSLLDYALQDYWHDVRARFADDWPRLTRRAAAIPATRIQDYVAALAGRGPLRVQ